MYVYVYMKKRISVALYKINSHHIAYIAKSIGSYKYVYIYIYIYTYIYMYIFMYIYIYTYPSFNP
jgi:hypothetical protein